MSQIQLNKLNRQVIKQRWTTVGRARQPDATLIRARLKQLFNLVSKPDCWAPATEQGF